MGEPGRGLRSWVWSGSSSVPVVCGLSYVRERAALAWWIHAWESLVGSVSPDFCHPGFSTPTMEPVQGASRSGVGAERALGELTREDHRRQSWRALCHQAILHVGVFADTRSYWRGRAKARNRGITFSAVLPDNFSKMRHQFPSPSRPKSGSVSPHPCQHCEFPVKEMRSGISMFSIWFSDYLWERGAFNLMEFLSYE